MVQQTKEGTIGYWSSRISQRQMKYKGSLLAFLAIETSRKTKMWRWSDPDVRVWWPWTERSLARWSCCNCYSSTEVVKWSHGVFLSLQQTCLWVWAAAQCHNNKEQIGKISIQLKQPDEGIYVNFLVSFRDAFVSYKLFYGISLFPSIYTFRLFFCLSI